MRELTVDARVERLDDVLAFIDSFLEEQGCPMRARMQIDVAAEELFVNIASYAYSPGTGTATLRLEAEADPPAVAITFIDSGIPYDPLKKPDPDITLSAAERPIGGLGIYMVKQSMDSVDYERRDGRNVLRILKRFAASA